jgi:hypothetical protein
MSGVNTRGVLAGGLLAGLVINIGYAIGELATAAELQRMIARLGLAAPGEAKMLTLALLGWVMGTIAVWLYAAMRPRYGAGFRTALMVGGAVWALGCLIPNLSVLAFGILTPAHFWMASAVDLVVVPAGTLAGARIYREAEPAESVAPAVAARVR